MTHPTHFTLWWSQWFITETRRFAYVLACYAWGRPYTTQVSKLHACMHEKCANHWKLTYTHAFGSTQAQFIAIAAQPSADRQPDPNRMNMQDWKIYAQNFTHYSCFPSFHGVYLSARVECFMYAEWGKEREIPVCLWGFRKSHEIYSAAEF